MVCQRSLMLRLCATLFPLLWAPSVAGLAAQAPETGVCRRSALGWIVGAAAGGCASSSGLLVVTPPPAHAGETPDRLDVEDFLKRGQVSNPMGVSGQAGKSRPETGVLLRDGSEVFRDPRTGDVLAEILLLSANQNDDDSKTPVLASYSSPWPLATGTVFDVECRNAKTGDGAFLAVTTPVQGKSISDLKDSFFLENLLSPTGRFSFYGPPTDVKVRDSKVTNNGNMRVMDLSFSTVSQATQTEFPRRARLIATVPPGSNQAVMLVASASASRWNKGSEQAIGQTIDSFRAIPAPKTSMKVRAKERRSG